MNSTTLLRPKEQWIRDKNKADRINMILENPELQEAIRVAFAEYCFTLPGGDNPQRAWDANSRRQGAVEFIHELCAIGIRQETQQHPIAQSLDYNT
jgi:hypothetical protein